MASVLCNSAIDSGGNREEQSVEGSLARSMQGTDAPERIPSLARPDDASGSLAILGSGLQLKSDLVGSLST